MSGLAIRATVTEILAAHAVLVGVVARSFGEIFAGLAALNDALGNTKDERHGERPTQAVDFSFPSCHHRKRFDAHDLKHALDRLKRDTWSQLVERLEVRRAMSVARQNELDRWLREDALPPLEVEPVFAWAERTFGALQEIHAEAIAEVFEFLRPRGHTGEAQLKTNSELEVPRRVILRGWVDFNPTFQSRPTFDYTSSAQATALENVWNAISGKGLVHRAHISDLDAAMRAGSEGETEHFRFSMKKNRRLHLEFKSAKTLAEFNRRAGEKRLKPATRRAA